MGKIVIIGAGHVGSMCALNLAMSGICREIVMIDINKEKAASQAKDVADATAFTYREVYVHDGGYEHCDDADIIVNAVGISRKPGQTRLDQLGDTIAIMDEVIGHLKETRFDGIIISISNPCDIVANYIRKEMNYPAKRVFGTGTSLDTARLRRTLSELTNVSMKSITCFAMGEHGDSSMVPLSHVTMMGKPLMELMSEDPKRFGEVTLETLEERTHNIGMEIVIGKGSTEFGIGAALTELCKAVLYNEHRVFPVSVYLTGEYGQQGLMTGVPAIIGNEGVESVIELKLTASEQQAFDHSCDIIREYIKRAEEN